MCYKDIPGIQPQDLPKALQSLQTFQSFQTFQTFQSFITFQPFQAILQVPVFPGNPTHSSILQLECIFYSSIGFHRNSTEYQLNNYKHFYKHFILQRKGDVVISVRIDILILIARMTFNSSLSCLMSKVSIEITINTSKWHERT